MILTLIISCKKDKEVITNQKNPDIANLAIDSAQVLNIENPDYSGVFVVNPQNIDVNKVGTIFYQNGNALFYFDQNASKGNIKIDGKDYALNQLDFNENNYTLSGENLEIEAENGDFEDQTTDCIHGKFPVVKVTLNGKSLNIPSMTVQDCPNYKGE